MTAINRPDPIKKSSLVSLRAIIKGCADEACFIRATKIRKLEKWEKYHAWNEKRQLGDYARHHLLAYGFLTGRAYKELEPNVEDRRISETGWMQAVIDVECLYQILKLHAPQFFASWARAKITKEDLKHWIQEGKPFFLTKDEFLAKKAAEKLKGKKVA